MKQRVLRKLIITIVVLLFYQWLLATMSDDKNWEYFTGERYGDYIETKQSNKTLTMFGSIKKNNQYIGNLIFNYGTGIVFFNFKKFTISVYNQSPF